jgi:hypothetical protein
MTAESHDARDERIAVALWRLLHMTLLPALTAQIATGANRSAAKGTS